MALPTARLPGSTWLSQDPGAGKRAGEVEDEAGERRIRAVYQANETGVRHELSEEPVVVARLPVRRGGRGRGRGRS